MKTRLTILALTLLSACAAAPIRPEPCLVAFSPAVVADFAALNHIVPPCAL